jgi:hypothetical protein
MVKLCIEISDKNVNCWKQYKRALAGSARGFADEKGVTIGNANITDDDAMSGLFDCVKEEGIFCWSLLWDIVERTVAEEKEGG